MMIREFADPTDREALVRCIVDLQEHERTLDPTMPEGKAMADDYLGFLLSRCREYHGRIFLAGVSDEVVGFICVFTAVPPSKPDKPRQAYAYISDLFVHAASRSQGIGRRLMREAEDFAQASGAGEVRIGVHARNENARRLYESCGFEEYHVELAKTIRSMDEAD